MFCNDNTEIVGLIQGVLAPNGKDIPSNFPLVMLRIIVPVQNENGNRAAVYVFGH